MSRLPTPRNALDADSDGAASHPIAIQVIERAMRLLDALAAQPDPVTLKELSATTGLHASTAHRILNDLVVGRYVERVDNGLYQLGMRLLELGSLVKGRLNVREAAVSAMRSLHKLTGQTINLSVQQGDEIVYIERAWSERSGMQVVRAIGGARAAAPDVHRQAVPVHRRHPPGPRLRAAHRIGRAHAQQPD